MLRPLLLVAPFALALVLPGAAGAGEIVEVDIANFAFDPSVVQIHAGDAVLWRNLDDFEHTTTLDGVWDSGELWQDETFAYTFDLPGVFPYRCAFHPTMVGAVVVQP
ncbi:MAG TPA: plastocyanin/azurin family copper-binding protein [Candidatus Thermoplasmatota archaeon]|jgi:plastocyanin|nr:plastocyanin/azurin family copper-binding protein [Candidatus Thermoplasmatota archaeon]